MEEEQREREKPERVKREKTERGDVPGRLGQNWATEHNPGRTEERKNKSMAWKQGRDREKVIHDRRRGGRGEVLIK